VRISGAVELHDLGVAHRFAHEMPAHRRDRRPPGDAEDHVRIDEIGENPCSGEGDTVEAVHLRGGIPCRHDVSGEAVALVQLLLHLGQLIDR
jgi:hypothetical protein